MILIIPSSSPWEATLPLYRQANRGSEAVDTQYHTAGQRESQESVFRRAGGGFLAQTPGSTSWVDLGVHCPGQCPDAPGRGRQSFHPPINQGGDWVWLSHLNAGRASPSLSPRTGWLLHHLTLAHLHVSAFHMPALTPPRPHQEPSG